MEQADLNYIKTLSGGDKAFEQKLIAIIKTEFPIERAVYESNIKKLNFKLAAENVHKLKHKISILGLEKSYEVAVAYEEQLITNRMSLKNDFEVILQQISKFLETI